MKQFALAAVTAVIFTGGMFAGLVEKEVAEVRGEAPITEALALDNAEIGTCKGMAAAMCYPAYCIDDECPSNNQCTGTKKCNTEHVAVGPGQTVYSCTLSGICNSSEDSEVRWNDQSTDFLGSGLVIQGKESDALTRKAASTLYTSYY